MILIKPDKDRRIDIPGVPVPVPRPVDIDQGITGFTNLRTLRIYRFETDSVIEGHAEEDEVFIVLLAGSIELSMVEHLSTDPPRPVMLSVPGDEDNLACAAFLPPGGAYKLIAKTGADVAYARATPTGTRPPKVFFSSARPASAGVSILLDATDYAERLRVRFVQIDARQKDTALLLLHESEDGCEALVYVRTVPAGGAAAVGQSNAEPILLDSWDTVSVRPGERPALQIALGSLALVLVVLAVD